MKRIIFRIYIYKKLGIVINVRRIKVDKDINKFKLNQETHDYIYKLLENQIFNNKKSCDFPIAVVLGGQPGAGKAVLIDNAKKEFDDNNVVIINGDEFRRMHPNLDEILEYAEEDYAMYTDADVRVWTSDLFEKAINDKYNIIFEGTMRTNRICDTLKKLKDNGFFIELKILAVNGIDSRISTMERYEKQKNAEGYGRITPSDSHRNAYYGMLDTLEDIESQKCFDTLEISTRNGDIVYYNDLKQNKIFSKYDLGISDTLIKSREELKPSMEEVEKRLNNISKSRENRGEEPLQIDNIIEKINSKNI